jgi:hypothetical protein
MAYNVKFSKGSLANYKALNKDASTIYFITDTGALYLGETLIADATDLTDIEKAIGTLTSLDTTTKSDLVSAINEVLGKVNDATEADAVTLTVADTATDGYLKTYVLTQGTEEIGKIDIPKDLVVKSGEVVTNPEGQDEGTYIKLVIANQEAPLYINVKTLVDVYTAQKNATQIQLAVSDTNEISATIVAGSVGTTEIADKAITLAKLSEELQTAISNANSAVQKIETGSTNGTISVDGTDVGVKGLGSAAYENKDTFDAAGAASAVLGTDDDDATTVTVKGNREAITALQEAVGDGGSVATKISDAIDALDSTVSQTAGDDGVSATVVEEDGKLKSVSVAIAAETYDTYGAASTAESNAKDYADGLASNYDATGSANTALTNAKAYTDSELSTALTWVEF